MRHDMKLSMTIKPKKKASESLLGSMFQEKRFPEGQQTHSEVYDELMSSVLKDECRKMKSLQLQSNIRPICQTL